MNNEIIDSLDKANCVDLSRHSRENILVSETLCTYPCEKEKFSVIQEFLKQHPTRDLKDLNIYVIEQTFPEDYYGNGGDTVRTLIISEFIPESQEEKENRIAEEERSLESELVSIQNTVNSKFGRLYDGHSISSYGLAEYLKYDFSNLRRVSRIVNKSNSVNKFECLKFKSFEDYQEYILKNEKRFKLYSTFNNMCWDISDGEYLVKIPGQEWCPLRSNTFNRIEL